MKFLQEMIAKKKSTQQAPQPAAPVEPAAPEAAAKTFEAPEADWGTPSAEAWDIAEATPAPSEPEDTHMNGASTEFGEADPDYEDSMTDISLDLREERDGYQAPQEDDETDPVFGATKALAASEDDDEDDEDGYEEDAAQAPGYDEDFDEDLEPIQPRLGARRMQREAALNELRSNFIAENDSAEADASAEEAAYEVDETYEDEAYGDEDAYDNEVAASDFEEAPEEEVATLRAEAGLGDADDDISFDEAEEDDAWDDEAPAGIAAAEEAYEANEGDAEDYEDEASLEDGLEMAGRIADNLQAEADEIAATAPPPEPEELGRPDTRVIRATDHDDVPEEAPQADASMYFEQPPEERLMEKTNEILAGSAAKAAQRKLWDNDGAQAPQAAPGEPAGEMQPKRRAGRVKTRLLGFHRAEATSPDVFAAEAKPRAVMGGPAMFPVGWILVVKGPGRGASYPLFAGASKIGRGEDQAIRLDFGDYSISRDNHAAVAYDDESHRFFLGHGGKANLVRLNNTPVLSTETLTDGDEIRIGETTLRFVALCGPEFSWEETGEDDERHAAIR